MRQSRRECGHPPARRVRSRSVGALRRPAVPAASGQATAFEGGNSGVGRGPPPTAVRNSPRRHPRAARKAWYTPTVRRGQSSVEPLLVGTAVVLLGLALIHYRFDEFYAFVVSVGKQWEGEEWFKQIVAKLQSLQ